VTSGFEIERHEGIFQGFLFAVERRKVRYHDERFDREILVHPGAVAVIAVDDDRQVVLLEQYRAATDSLIVEIPAGTCDKDDEHPERTAARELREETGLTADHLELLGSFLNSPGYSTQETFLFLASSLHEGDPEPAGVEEEASRILRCSLSEARRRMAQGEIRDAMTCLALVLVSERYGA
jgi:ADP-ribose pyrophosphatase